MVLLWREVEFWLRGNVDTHLKIPDNEKVFGYLEKDPDAFIINLAIINNKVVIYKRRPDRGELIPVNEVLRFTYNGMLNDKYDCGLHRKTELFEYRWRKCRAIPRSKFM